MRSTCLIAKLAHFHFSTCLAIVLIYEAVYELSFGTEIGDLE